MSRTYRLKKICAPWKVSDSKVCALDGMRWEDIRNEAGPLPQTRVHSWGWTGELRVPFPVPWFAIYSKESKEFRKFNRRKIRRKTKRLIHKDKSHMLAKTEKGSQGWHTW